MNNKLFKEDLEYRVYCFKHLGKKYSWRLEEETRNTLEFETIICEDRQATYINLKVNHKNLSIETTLNHPFKGVTTLLRVGDFSINIIEKIFSNPRTHTPEEIRSEYLPAK